MGPILQIMTSDAEGYFHQSTPTANGNLALHGKDKDILVEANENIGWGTNRTPVALSNCLHVCVALPTGVVDKLLPVLNESVVGQVVSSQYDDRQASTYGPAACRSPTGFDQQQVLSDEDDLLDEDERCDGDAKIDETRADER